MSKNILYTLNEEDLAIYTEEEEENTAEPESTEESVSEPEEAPEEADEEEYHEYLAKAQAETQSRWKSPYLWTSIAAVIAFIFGNWGLYDKIGLNEDSFKNLVNLILSAMATMGIVNNPTDAKKW